MLGITIAYGEYYLYKAYKQKVANSDSVGKERQYSMGEKVAWISDKGTKVQSSQYSKKPDIYLLYF